MSQCINSFENVKQLKMLAEDVEDVTQVKSEGEDYLHASRYLHNIEIIKRRREQSSPH